MPTAKKAILIWVLACLLLASGSVAWGQRTVPGGPSEYQVKAAFLYHFTRFVEWPASAFDHAGNSIKICVMGQDPFGPAADIIRGNIAQERVIQVTTLDNMDDPLDGCHVLFLKADVKDTAGVLARIKGRPILTVSDTEGFTDMGGMIKFVTVDNRIRFEINSRAANDSGLHVSSSLMKLALPGGK